MDGHVGPNVIDVLAALPLRHVQQLWLDIWLDHFLVEQLQPADIGTFLPNVTELHIGFMNAEYMAHGLQDAVGYLGTRMCATEDKTSGYPWPKLTVLTIESDNVDALSLRRELGALQEVLEARQANGCARLTSLTLLVQPLPSEGDLDSMRRFADEVAARGRQR